MVEIMVWVEIRVRVGVKVLVLESYNNSTLVLQHCQKNVITNTQALYSGWHWKVLQLAVHC